MRLVGDQDVRIDFTNPANQVKGLDLNGDGTIANNGVENVITGKAADFEIVDAYARNPLNETSITQNFLGDIAFDGTGFGGDGVTTDGNIVLGGLGADSIFGGIGNDFLTGGGIAASRVAAARAAYVTANPQDPNGTGYVAPSDSLSGGRNADFFFAELSALDATDGNRVNIDGGTTADDSVAGIVQTAQDADWLLFEASDDDEPVTINLRDESSTDNYVADLSQGNGAVINRSGQQVSTLRDIENFDASGNLYGFLDSMTDLQMGGRRTDDREVQNGTLNNGIGSSAQLIVSGSKVANIIIGGYDNDQINGNAGNDLLMGGNLANLINPNLLTIVNNGMDNLFGGAGNDNIVFEADGGNIEGDITQGVNAGGNDTLWLTNLALGTKTAADMTTDGVLRFDLDSQDIDTANGYGGADVGSKNLTPDDTQDQTNYKVATNRVTVQDMENVIATGLGAVDYDTDGSNVGDIAHLSQVNQAAYAGDLTLRGTNGVNVLYASSGNDKIEGRTGGTYTTNGDGTLNTTLVNGVQMPTGDARDKLSGGNGDDDFIFNLQVVGGDGVDVIHRQADLLDSKTGLAGSDNLWDGYNAATDTGTFIQDFGQVSAAITANSKLTLTLTDSAHPTDLSGFPVNGLKLNLDGVTYTLELLSGIQSTYTAFTAGLNDALDLNPALKPLTAVLNANNTITITDPAGKTFATPTGTGYTWVGNVTPPAGALVWTTTVGDPTSTQTQDRLIYRAYEDRLDNELVNDNAITGSTISLGVDAYAEDLVINFAADGTRIAEDQSYTINFANLTTQDVVTVAVNGVTYTLTVGVDLDGNSIAAEDGVGDTQVNIQSAFLVRMNAFINSFMDNDTAAGQVNSATNGTTTLTLTQATYNTEETVFMTTPRVTVVNSSAGEVPVMTVVNNAGHEVLLFNYDGRNLLGTSVNLDGTNVKFWGDTETNQSLLQTANNLTGGTITGNNAVLIDGGANDLAGIVVNAATNANLATNFSVHGDDFILGASKVDTINTGTGDDRVQGSGGNDVLDGGKNYYAVRVLGETESRVLTWNAWEAANPLSAQSLLADPTLAGKTLSSVTLIGQSEDGITVISGAFNDTLIYAQNDFTAGATKFTVTLDDYTVAGGVVSLNNGGAGKMTVDLTGNGVSADDSTSTFKNFENIRTVSGTGKAVAGIGGGQGNDTLDVTALSTSTGGIAYDLTNNADVTLNAVGAGKVTYSTNAHVNNSPAVPVIARPVAADFETLIMKVDGVESVKTGLGDDLLIIDETEAAKDNSFTASLGADRIDYQNFFATTEVAAAAAGAAAALLLGATEASVIAAIAAAGGSVALQAAANTVADTAAASSVAATGAAPALDLAIDKVAQPTVTIKVNTTPDQDKVEMTGGRVGSVVATDTLDSVEYITLNTAGRTATSVLENDVVDVRAMVAGAIVSYVDGTVKDLANVTQVTIEGIAQMENVWADGNDTVVVASSALMGGLNTREDVTDATTTAVTYKVTLGAGNSGAAASTMTVAGLTLTAAATPVGAQVAVNATADTVGAAFAAQSVAAWQAALQTGAGGLTAAQAATLTSVAYNASNNELVFAFGPATATAGITLAALGNPASAAGATLAYTEALANSTSDITFATFLDFDEINPTTGKRVAFNSQNSAQITDTVNNGEYTFDLSKSGVTTDSDTVDYSFAANSISAKLELDPLLSQYVMVDGDTTYAFDAASRTDDNDRIDVLTSVEKIVASQGESVIDLTSSTKGLEIKFGAYSALNYVAAFDRDVYNVQLVDLSNSQPITRSFVEYREAGLIAAPVVNTATAANPPTVVAATWNRIEGSDNAERVILNSAHTTDNDTFNLRGGVNEVKYNELTRSITTTLSVVDFDPLNPVSTVANAYAGIYASTNASTTTQQSGTVMAVTQFQDGNGAVAIGGGTHVATSYTANNAIVATGTTNSLRIAASQDAEDTLLITGLGDKTFLMAETGTTDNQITVKLGSALAANSIILTGYEILQDAASNDAYDFGSLTTVQAGLTFNDTVGDHDAVIVPATAGTTGFNGDANGTISLVNLNKTKALGGFGIEFDVLDITKVTASGLTLTGTATVDASDELVASSLSKITNISAFESLVLTDAAAAAGAVVLDTTLFTIKQGSTTIQADASLRTLSAGGLVFENELGNSYVASALAATAVNLSATGAGPVTLVGGAGNDTLTGAGGSDVLVGGAGNDVLNAGVAQEVQTFTLAGNLGADGTPEFVLDFMNAGTAFSLVSAPGTFAEGSSADVVGLAVAAKWNADLVTLNTLFDANVNSNITSVTYAAGKLNFNFAPGFNVATSVNLGAGGNFDVVDGQNATFISTISVVDGGDGGANVFRGGAGVDIVNGGAGNDRLTVVGSVDAAQAAAYVLDAAVDTQAEVDAIVGGVGVVNMVTDLQTVHTTTDVSTGDVYNGGLGFDTLHVFGNADLSGSTINADIEAVAVHSNVTITATQLAAMTAAGTQLSFAQAGSTLTITGLSGTLASLDLSALGASVAANLQVIVPGVTAITSLVRATGSTFAVYPGTAAAPGTAITPGATVAVALFGGTSGNDVLGGSVLADKLFGYTGDDTITGGAGADTMNGGEGTDTLSYADVTAATDHSLTGISGMAINASSATITAVTIATAAGGTVVLGGGAAAAGSDLLAGTAGYLATSTAASVVGMVRDTFTGFEVITGSGLNDVIYGGAGAETINGGVGIDYISGGAGADVLSGGAGADLFAFGTNGSGATVGTLDRITDFNTGGSDVLTFGAGTTVLAADASATVAGTNVQTSAGGVVTFAAGDNTLALKIVAILADTQLDAAGSVAYFVDGANGYAYYAGAAVGNADDQIIELTGVAGLTTITGGATTTIA